MIGAFFIAQQYLQETAGYSALGAAAALTLIAVLVGVGAPLAGRLTDRHGERPTAMLGFAATAARAAAARDPGSAAPRPGSAAAADPVRDRHRPAVRARLACRPERRPAGQARPRLLAALDEPAARGSGRLRGWPASR